MERSTSDWNNSSLPDALDGFPPESKTDFERQSARRDTVSPPALTAAPAPVAHTSTAVKHLALADVLASRMQMHWFEVVAIAQGVCHAILRTAGPADPKAPPLSHVALTSQGAVEITAGVLATDAPVPFVRGILRAALPDNKPVQLRLFVLQLDDSPSHIATIRDLSKALEYFERPGRSELIRAVVDRYSANDHAPLEPKPEVEEPKITPADVAKSPDRRWRSWLAAAVIVGAVSALFGAGRWWMNRTPATTSPTPVSEDVPPAVVAAARPRVAAGNLRAPGARIRLVSGPEKFHAAVGKEPSVLPRAGAASVRREAVREGSTATGVFMVTPPPTGQATHGLAVPVDEFSDEGRTAEIGAVVYDSRDADVTPPIELSPHLPSLRSGISPADIATFDVVIDEAGEVQSVRAHVPLKRWDHVMLLSAMKAWHFRPAMKDGHPVAYRKQLLIEMPIY